MALFNRGQTPADAVKFQELLQLGQVDPGLFQTDPDFASGQAIGRSVGAALLGRFAPPSVNVQAAQEGERKKQMLADFAASEGANDPNAMALMALRLNMPELAVNFQKIAAENKRAAVTAGIQQRQVAVVEQTAAFAQRPGEIKSMKFGDTTVVIKEFENGDQKFQGLTGAGGKGINIFTGLPPDPKEPTRGSVLNLSNRIKEDPRYKDLRNESTEGGGDFQRDNAAAVIRQRVKDMQTLAKINRIGPLPDEQLEKFAMDDVAPRVVKDDRFPPFITALDQDKYDPTIKVKTVTESFEEHFGKQLITPGTAKTKTPKTPERTAGRVKPVIPPKFNTTDEVGEAFRDGTITEQQARKILKDQFGIQ